MVEYFSGKELYRYIFSYALIEDWYEEVYATLYGEQVSIDQVSGFHNLRNIYGYKYLKKVSSLENVLGLGTSWEGGLIPIQRKYS